MFERWADKLRTKTPEEEIEFQNFSAAPKAPEAPAQAAPAAEPSSIEGNNIELKVVRPTSFEEVSTIADYLIAGCTVVLNLELLDKAATIRMLDFINGVTYTKDGEIKNVALNTYIITPNGIDVHE